MTTTPIPPTTCPHCGTLVDTHTSEADAQTAAELEQIRALLAGAGIKAVVYPPRRAAGDLAVCVACCGLVVFGEDCVIHKPSAQQMAAYREDPALWGQIQDMIRNCIRAKADAQRAKERT